MALLEHFGEDIWIASGSAVEIAGFRYPTRMAIIRLADGGLFVWSPIALSDALRAEVNALGDVRFLLPPNSLHHVFLPEWRAAYPGATLFAPPGLRARRKDIAFDKDLEDAPGPDWIGQIDQVAVRGNSITTEIVFFHVKSGAVLFTDLIQHFPDGWFKGWRALIARLDGMTGSEPRVPRKFRVAFNDRKTARECIDRILTWPARKVLMTHADPVRENGRAFIGRAFDWLR